jgi:Meckel syndrome type 1 protein
VTKPFSDEPAPSRVDTAPRVASASAPSTPAAVARTAVSPARPAPRTPDPSLGLSAAAVAAVEVPRRVADRRASRGQSQRAGQRARQAPAVASSRTAAAVASAAAADPILPSTTLPAKPFQPQHVEATARPWPRAVLPQYSGGGAMTAAFGASAAAGSPSFYPFEPQPVAEPDAATTSGDESPRR